MSRKPPKLAPVEGKESVGYGNGKTPQCPPPLKQGGNIGANSSATLSTPRRSSLTRHFLNCNGGTPSANRRFPSKFPSVTATTTPSPVSSVIPKTENVTASNGCGDEEEEDKEKPVITTPPVVNSTNKVNGTISNGLPSEKTNDTLKLGKRSKSLGVAPNKSDSVSSSIDTQNIQRNSVTVNGKKRESVNSRNNVSDFVGSQNVKANVTKRTNRFSQNSATVQRANKGPSCSTPLSSSESESTTEEKTMPALVACELATSITKENPSENDKIVEPAVKADEAISEEPKIIRQGDTVIKSYIDEKTGRISVFERGMKLEVCDFGSGKWYPAKVMNIDWDKQEILVHYSNWSSRYDEWISMKSSRVRPGIDTNVVRLQFVIGERVEALWPMDSRRYSGTVTQKLPQDCYEVRFDDGIKIKRSAHQLFKVSHTEESEDKPPPLVTAIPEPESNKSSNIQTETKPSPSTRKKSIKLPPTPRASTSKLPPVEPEMKSPLPIPPHDENGPSGNRPSHFSVFDPPQGELGKRKRTVHDYSALVKGRQRGPRRPKSEGSSVACSPTTSTTITDETSTVTAEEISPKVTTDSPESGSDTKRRQKSGSTTQVPANEQPSKDTPQELPLVEPVSAEQPSVTEQHNETPSKKRKHPSSSTPTTAEPKIPPKPEAAQFDTPPTPSSGTTTTSTRRTKSLSTLQHAILSPLTDTEVPNDTKVDSGFVDELGNAIVIEQNAQDGFWKCPLNKCGKNFRKDSLLKMHFKHYHPELKVANARGIANVVQMAQARTAFDNDPTDYHSWPKHSNVELPPPPDPIPTPSAEVNDLPFSDTTENQHTHRKTPKNAHHPKPVSPEKVSPVASHSAEDASLASFKTTTIESTQGASKALGRSPRLRLNRRRFVLSKYSRIRASSKQSPSVSSQNEAQSDQVTTDVIATDAIKASKNAVSEALYSDESTVMPSPTSSLLSTSNTPSPSVSDQFSLESFSGSSSGDPVFPPSNSELEPQIITSNRTLKGRWSRSHLRRGFINSGIRRVGSGVLQNSTSLFLKKRMQLRKFMGKRGSRQKRISILSRISSGRMRQILDVLNQRSLKRKRFRAARRYRDVKVDVINCVCNSKTEFGLMIQCELCLCWQHGSCFNVQSNSQLPDFYACQSCSEPEKVRMSRRYEWAEPEFYRLGKLPSFPFASPFPKEDARIMKMCTNLSANLIETYSMIKGLKVKERICFGQPEHPQLYEWSAERAPPQEEIQKDRFNKYFKPVLRRLLMENKSDPAYYSKMRKLAEARMKLRKYSDAVESARLTLKKKLGCRAAAFLNHICDRVLTDMVRTKRRAGTEDTGDAKKERFDLRKRLNAEQAFQRLRKVGDETLLRMGGYDNKYSSYDDGASSSQTSNGMKRDVTLNLRDYSVLKRYLKEKRTTDANISLTLTRVSEEFPEDWKNLMKLSRSFIDENRKEAYLDAKLKWITSVIVTFNTLRILLRQIYSENNSQKQKNFCLDFERTTSKLFDLFGIGLAEEKVEMKRQQNSNNQRKRVRGLETLDMISLPVPSGLVKSKPISKLAAELDDARKDILSRLSSSTKSISSKDVEDLLTTASETKRLEETIANNSCVNASSLHNMENKSRVAGNNVCENIARNSRNSDTFAGARKIDGHIAFEFNENVHLLDAIDCAGDVPEDECTEEDLNLEFPESNTQEEEQSPTYTGIIPVPANSKITPDVCRKNLVRDIILQQQQIDVYLDKIEAQIIKLSRQGKTGEAVTSMKPAELSAQRTRMLHSLELVSRLSKTVIGDNDLVEPEQSEDMDVSETTISDYSDMDFSSESDGFDNASNYSGTDTETADEGDNTGDDDLLDV